MSITTEQYAELSNRVYETKNVAYGVFGENGDGRDITIDGVKFVVRERVSNPQTGYQGAIYQRKDTGELVVAHKGTQNLGDVRADANMVLNRINDQANDAIALTQRALNLAKDYESRGMHTPVTITGHSLGGGLTEITTCKFKLHGETFNGYGAASLGRQVLGHPIPEGGNAVINHVVAGDAVSAASPHYGQVRIYASEQDVRTLTTSGFALPIRNPVMVPATATVLTAIDHGIGNFLPHDKEGHPKPSILNPHAEKLAHDNMDAIKHYRSDVQATRGILTFVTNPYGVTKDAAQDMYQNFQKNLSEAAKHSQESHSSNPQFQQRIKDMGHAAQQFEMHRWDVRPHSDHFIRPLQPTTEPLHSRQISEAATPPSETAILARHSNPHIVALHERVQNEPGLSSYTETERSRIAAATCLECQKTGKNIAGMTEVESHAYKGKALFTADDPIRAARDPYTSSATVDVARAVDTPVQDSLNQMQSVQVAQAQAQEQAQSRAASGPVIF